ncbi:XRE family transcriptional regulator [Streptomyces sp. NPDC090077]|uniref:XRE family transcriptional regulator n=1 Tax=Streptomyces sp. NPDC090077 TaxID=3365938 RepID=UPI00381650F7
MMANETLRRHRRAHRWTQTQTPELVSAEVQAATGRYPELDANWISRLERGAISWPASQYRSALCKVFQVASEADLGLYPKGAAVHDTGTPAPTDEVRGCAADTELSSRLARYAADTNVNSIVLEQFEADVERLARDFVSRPLALLVPEIRTVRSEVFRLLEGRQPPAHTLRLYVVAGWLSGLAAHVSLDLGDRSAAATHARTVVQCAEIAEHPRLRAWARSFQSLAAYWAEDYRQAGNLAQAGLNDGRAPGSGTIKARLLSLEARARAAEGDHRSALRALALAQEARMAAEPDELPGIFSFPEAKQWTYSGTAFLSVGGGEQIRQAVSASNRALEMYQAGPDEDRSPGDLQAAHLDLATAHVASGELEEAGARLAGVFASRTRTASISIRLRNLGTLLGSAPYRDAQPAIDLRAQIHEATGRAAHASDRPEAR